uniref:Uncharacterized protein n=1 Tax=Arundo donax TaxID=35708 RepID=A0A0A9G9S0_ARUDO
MVVQQDVGVPVAVVLGAGAPGTATAVPARGGRHGGRGRERSSSRQNRENTWPGRGREWRGNGSALSERRSCACLASLLCCRRCSPHLFCLVSFACFSHPHPCLFIPAP